LFNAIRADQEGGITSGGEQAHAQIAADTASANH
jgi:hypothetical protein